jgi:hypothetical protein
MRVEHLLAEYLRDCMLLKWQKEREREHHSRLPHRIYPLCFRSDSLRESKDRVKTFTMQTFTMHAWKAGWAGRII